MTDNVSWLDKYFRPEVTPTLGNASTGTLNNVETLDVAGEEVSAIRFTGVAPTITGLLGGVDGRRVILMAVGGSLTLLNESASSSAANRITLGGVSSVAYAVGSAALLVYDGAASRWRLTEKVDFGTFVAGGDLTGSSSSQTVAKVKGTTVTTAGGTLTTGAVLRVTGASVADWGAVNLALAAAVTGILPVANGGTGLNAVGSVLQYLRTNGTGTALEWATLPTMPSGAIVGTSDAQALTNKIINGASNTLTVRLASDVSGTLPIANGGTGHSGASSAMGALAVDWTLSNVFTKTLAAGSNTITFSNSADGMCIIVILTGAASTVTWPTVKWAGGAAPTQTASGTDVYTFVKAGSTIYGSVVQAMA